MSLQDAIKWNADGLVCAVVQDRVRGTVLMQAWMNAEALQQTVQTGQATFWSRSRQELWVKGLTSGHTQAVVDIRLDCDADCLLLQVDPAGPACHTGETSCYYREPTDDGQWQATTAPAGHALGALAQLLEQRKSASADSSYVASLYAKGREKILQKLGEEAIETVLAGSANDKAQITSEMADLWFHALVLLADAGLSPDDVLAELARREGVSGLVEKAARTKGES